MIPLFSTPLTASGIVFSGPVYFGGFLLGTDGVNDPTITIYDGTDNTGLKIVPTNTYDASALGLNGAQEGSLVKCNSGIYVEITGSNVEIAVRYRPNMVNV